MEWEGHAWTVLDKIIVRSVYDIAWFWVENYDKIRCNGAPSQVAEIFVSMHLHPWIFRPQAQLMLNDRKFRERPNWDGARHFIKLVDLHISVAKDLVASFE
jgi:hypothetical protein